MLEIQRLRSEKESVIEGLKKRHFDASKIVENVLSKDSEWRTEKGKLEDVASKMNQISKQIGILFKEGNQQEANEAKAQTTALKTEENELKLKVDQLQSEITELMYSLPNVPNHLVKPGKSELDNETVEEFGVAKEFAFKALPHWEIASKFNLIDFELGVKITGAGFPMYIGKGAKLQRALISFFLDEAEKSGYVEHQAPIVVNESSALGTGQLPDKEGQMYYMPEDDLYLIPTRSEEHTSELQSRL